MHVTEKYLPLNEILKCVTRDVSRSRMFMIRQEVTWEIACDASRFENRGRPIDLYAKYQLGCDELSSLWWDHVCNLSDRNTDTRFPCVIDNSASSIGS